MQLANTQRRYGGAAILLHWLMAAMIVTLVAHSLWQLHEGRKRRAALAVAYPA